MMTPETPHRRTAGRVIALLALAPLLVTLAPAQDSTWTKIKLGKRAEKPATRYGQAMAYDSNRQVVVMFGGYGNNGTTVLDETWEWDGSNWSQKSPATSPSARFCPGAMAYDEANGVCVLFGGSKNVNGQQMPNNETWTWDGSDWNQKTPANKPSARYSQAMSYDSTGHVVLFGGTTGLAIGSQADTWMWDGTAGNWIDVTPTPSPPKTSYHAMAYDSDRGRVVMFGGRDTLDNLRGETWEWDGSTWADVTPTNANDSPTERRWHAMAYDISCGCIVMFGGDDASTSNQTGFLNDSWKWNGSSWSELTFKRRAKEPPPRIYHAMAYDAARGRTVLQGSWAGGGVAVKDTWVLEAH